MIPNAGGRDDSAPPGEPDVQAHRQPAGLGVSNGAHNWFQPPPSPSPLAPEAVLMPSMYLQHTERVDTYFSVYLAALEGHVEQDRGPVTDKLTLRSGETAEARIHQYFECFAADPCKLCCAAHPTLHEMWQRQEL